MKRSRGLVLGLVCSCIVAFIPASSLAATPKPGTPCAKGTKVVTTPLAKFTCVKSGKKFVWKRQVIQRAVAPAPTPSPFAPSTPTECDPDPLVPSVFAEYQAEELRRKECPPPYRYVIQRVTTAPSTSTTPESQWLPVNQCKLERSSWFDIEQRNGQHIMPRMVFQVVPFVMDDIPTSTTPQQDWKYVFDWVEQSLESMSDVPADIEFRMPTSYIAVSGNLKEYGLGGNVGHGDPAYALQRQKLVRKILEVADPLIDFTGSNQVLFVAPSSSNFDVLGNQIVAGTTFTTAERTLGTVWVSSPFNGFNAKAWNARNPIGFIHELIHITNTSEDYYGDVSSGGKNLGSGKWSNASGARQDFFAWDRWTFGFMADSQIACINGQTSTTVWLRPTTATDKNTKLLMIPLSRTTAIVVESWRNSGFNYKIPVDRLGTLVYKLDVAAIDDKSQHGDGVNIICPTNRPCKSLPGLEDAALRPGDYVVAEGIKITVKESGDFGDVVSVERA